MSSVTDPSTELLTSVSVEIPWEEVEKKRRSLLADVARKAVVPGFRKGKVPQSVLNRLYESEVLEAFGTSLVPSHLVAEVSKRDLKVAYGPMVEEMHFEEGRPLKATGKFELFPVFELGTYRGLKVQVQPIEVTDEMVDGYVEELRLRNATYQNLDPRPLVEGDIAVVSLTGYHNGDKVLELTDEQIDLGNPGVLEDFKDALLGRLPDDRLDFEISHPDDMPERRIAGRTVHYQGQLTTLQRRELPDLDDEFAKDLHNDLASLEDLRSMIRKQMDASLTRTQERSIRQQVVIRLAESHPMKLPEMYVNQRLEAAIREALQRHSAPESEAMPPDLVETVSASEVLQMRAELILDRIAMVEGITVSNEEVTQQILKYAQSEQITPERARNDLEQDGAIARWMESKRRDKALQFVIDEAEHVTPAETEDSEAGGDVGHASEADD